VQLARAVASVLLLALVSACDSGTEAAKVDAIFAEWDKPDTPGCAVAAIRDGEIVYSNGYGMANLDHDISIGANTVFHVASVSKQFTAAAIALLVLDGELSLDDEVHSYVPELPDFGYSITIRHLVHHTSGLRDQWELLGLNGWRYSQDLITDDDVMSVVIKQRYLNFPPGEQYLYSNTGYTLLSLIVERVSGKSLREFTRERIFAPLNMDDTFFRDDFREVVKNQAYGYVPVEEGFELSVTNFDTVGATSLLTTAEDLARWEDNFDSGLVGGEAFVELIHRRGQLADGTETDYAFGLQHADYRGLNVIEHSGGDAGYGAHFMRFPDQRFAVACFCNVPAGPTMLARQVADIYLADELAPAAESQPGDPGDATPTPEVEHELLQARVGLYWHEESDQFLDIVHSENQLKIRASGMELPLTPVTADRFRVDVFPVQVVFANRDAGDTAIELLIGSNDPRSYIHVVAATPSAEDLIDYVGTYASDELDVPYRVALAADGSLTMSWLKYPDQRLHPARADVFRSDEVGTARFMRDESGQIAGFTLSTGRVRDLRFLKQM